MRAISIGAGREVNDRNLGTCGGTKQPKNNNISVIDGVGVKCILGTDERISVNCKIPGVSLGYAEIQGVKALVGCKIPGVNLGYEKSRRVKMKNAAVKLIVLDSKIDYENVGEYTGVRIHPCL